MTLGEKLQYLRKEKGISQEQLAEQMTISRQAISKWELDTSIPDVENIIQISKLFDVTTDWLLMGDSAFPEKPIAPRLPQAKNQETKTMLLKALQIVLITGGIALVLLLFLLGFSLMPV
nr:helix-turn-helix transcriptional regulator [uncultured Eisenbergiella sp.]